MNPGDEAGAPAAAGTGAAPDPVITDVDNNEATPKKKFKKGKPDQQVRIHGRDFTATVKVKLESTSGHAWSPTTHNNVPRQGTAPNYHVVVEAKPHRAGGRGLLGFFLWLLSLLIRLLFTDTGDLTVTVTNNPPSTMPSKKAFVVDYV
jgi:hypothetical protein